MKPLIAITLAVAMAGQAVAADAPAKPAPLSRAIQEGFDKGFKACAPALDRFVKDRHEDDKNYAFLGSWNEGRAAGSVFNSITIEPFAESDLLTSFSATRNAAGTCDILVTSVVPLLDEPCAKVREEIFKAWKYVDVLSATTLLDDGSGGAAFLTPLTGGGCQIIKHVVLFEVPLDLPPVSTH